MLTFLGYTLVFLALLVSLYLVIRPEASSQSFLRTAAMGAQSSPFLLLSLSFIFEATSLDLVSSYVGEGLPLFYRISAVWGSRSGPLLMWASMMSVIAWLMSRDRTTDAATIRVMHFWTLLLLLISAGLRPFSPAIPGSAGEISPLLQTDLMVIHPPVVFVYYSLCLATASIAVSGLIRSRPSNETHASMIPWARYSFLAGTIGIGLGGLWAYTVLDWGGYWAWDPVETGSLLPWLALLAILHSRARPKASNPYALSPAFGMITGALVMHATLVTRANGVWASVHAFVGDGENSLPRDPYVRVLEIIDFTAVGFEIMVYMTSVFALLGLSVVHALREQRATLARKGITDSVREEPVSSSLPVTLLRCCRPLDRVIRSPLLRASHPDTAYLRGWRRTPGPLGLPWSPSDALLWMGVDLRVVPVFGWNRAFPPGLGNTR